MRKTVLALALAPVLAALALGAPLARGATAEAMKPRLVRTITDEALREVLATSGSRAIYVWSRERDGRIRCRGACAAAWPPVVVRKGIAVPRHVAGISGDFGTVRRADGARQLTLNERPLYTYAHERPGEVKCNNVDGWFAVRA
jgi:predicted lipoprotein with Yx(FWY)xxD motif